MNYSKVKEDVYNVVYANPKHLTAEEVYIILHRENPGVGIATVYRNLSKLAYEGRIQKLTGLGDADRYDGNTAKHFHFYCTDCKKVFDIEYPEESCIDRKVEEFSGHKVTNHDFVFIGVCKDCLKKEDI